MHRLWPSGRNRDFVPVLDIVTTTPGSDRRDRGSSLGIVRKGSTVQAFYGKNSDPSRSVEYLCLARGVRHAAQLASVVGLVKVDMITAKML